VTTFDELSRNDSGRRMGRPGTAARTEATSRPALHKHRRSEADLSNYRLRTLTFSGLLLFETCWIVSTVFLRLAGRAFTIATRELSRPGPTANFDTQAQ